MSWIDDIDFAGKLPPHPAVLDVLRYFEYAHLPKDLQGPSKKCQELAIDMCESLPSVAQLTRGLQKLLEAKDCFVRAALDLY